VWALRAAHTLSHYAAFHLRQGSNQCDTLNS
jgi:hypothetical protein